MNGKKLEELRVKNGFSRQELADLLYENSAHIQSWEEGWYVYGSTATDIEDMAEAFNMTEEDLRRYIEQDEDDDFDSDEDEISFGSYMVKLSYNVIKKKLKD